jgi:hypothetical protein
VTRTRYRSLNEAETFTRATCSPQQWCIGPPRRSPPEPDQITNLEKQYEELCRLREQVRKAERRKKNSACTRPSLNPIRSALNCMKRRSMIKIMGAIPPEHLSGRKRGIGRELLTKIDRKLRSDDDAPANREQLRVDSLSRARPTSPIPRFNPEKPRGGN